MKAIILFSLILLSFNSLAAEEVYLTCYSDDKEVRLVYGKNEHSKSYIEIAAMDVEYYRNYGDYLYRNGKYRIYGDSDLRPLDPTSGSGFGQSGYYDSDNGTSYRSITSWSGGLTRLSIKTTSSGTTAVFYPVPTNLSNAVGINFNNCKASK